MATVLGELKAKMRELQKKKKTHKLLKHHTNGLLNGFGVSRGYILWQFECN